MPQIQAFWEVAQTLAYRNLASKGPPDHAGI